MNCPFCEIVAGTRRAAVAMRTDRFIVFESSSLAEYVKYLIVPKAHYNSMNEVPADVLAEWLRTAQTFSEHQRIPSYRLQVNVGSQFQRIRHLHMQFSDIGARNAKRHSHQRSADHGNEGLP